MNKCLALAIAVAEIISCASLCADDATPKRLPWTTSHIHGSPDPPKPFVAARAFPKLEFKEALELVYEPLSKRWFALERGGKILSWPHDGDVDHVDLVADIKALHPDLDYLYGTAFHPKFAENHFVFITYTRGAGKDDGTKLSRFVLQDGKLDTGSEKVILTCVAAVTTAQTCSSARMVIFISAPAIQKSPHRPIRSTPGKTSAICFPAFSVLM